MKKKILFSDSESITTQLLISLILRETKADIYLGGEQDTNIHYIASEFNLFLETDRVHPVQFQFQNPMSLQTILSSADCLVVDAEKYSWFHTLIQASLQTGTDCLVIYECDKSLKWIQSISDEISQSGCRFFLCNLDEKDLPGYHEDPDMSRAMPAAALLIEYLKPNHLQPGLYKDMPFLNIIQYKNTLQKLGLEPEVKHGSR